MAHPPHVPPPSDRRDFLTKASAIVIGAGLALVAPVAGLFVVLDPLRRKSADGGAVRVASLDALPADGEPRKFPVLATRVDAWNRTNNVPVGAVYLRRVGEKVTACNAACPHAGCFVDFQPDNKRFFCPCHQSSFSPDGAILDKASPSPRALDDLAAEVRPGGEVWVKFQNFRKGVKERIPV
jgi:menaquinol-cytochrome c reductase iron-sulfur subunit